MREITGSASGFGSVIKNKFSYKSVFARYSRRSFKEKLILELF